MNATIHRYVCDAAQLLNASELVPYDGCLTVQVWENISPCSLRASVIGQLHFNQGITWYDRFQWATTAVPLGVYDVRLPVPGSNRKTFADQQAMLRPGEQPLPLVVAAIALLYCRSKGLPDPLNGAWARCREVADGFRVALTWGDDRLYIGNFSDDDRYDGVWLAAGTSAG